MDKEDREIYRNRVIEYLRFHNNACYGDIAATFGGDWGLTMDGILLAKDEGKIELVDGKYRLVEGV